MPDRKPLLAKLDVGDIFHAEYPNGAKCICLVLSVNDATIDARRVTSQENLEFDRQTGKRNVVSVDYRSAASSTNLPREMKIL